MYASGLFCKDISKVINACRVYSQICRGVCSTYNPLLFTSQQDLKQDFAPLSAQLSSSVVCISYHTSLVCESHIKVSSDFAARILADNQHSLYEELLKVRLHTSTRIRFKLLPSKTAAYRNSVLPAQSRLLVDRKTELNYYIQGLS